LVSAETYAENEAATTQPIQRCGFPGDLGRAAARKRGDHWTQHYLFGGGCDGRQGDPRISHLPYRFTPDNLIPHEDSMPTSLLRLSRETRNYTRVGKVLKERQPQTRAHINTKVTRG
jgi:hypothetical protein